MYLWAVANLRRTRQLSGRRPRLKQWVAVRCGWAGQAKADGRVDRKPSRAGSAVRQRGPRPGGAHPGLHKPGARDHAGPRLARRRPVSPARAGSFEQLAVLVGHGSRITRRSGLFQPPRTPRRKLQRLLAGMEGRAHAQAAARSGSGERVMPTKPGSASTRASQARMRG